jgi:serine/threonine-protein kinase SRPK3
MTSMFQAARNLVRKPMKPLRFPTAGYEVVNQNVLLEEERFGDFKKGIYYPVNIGDIFASKYQVVGKLGFGVTSTVWLARDLQ